MAEVVEKTGKTVEDAYRAALAELNVPEDRVTCEVLEEPSKGFLGLIGTKPAKVKAAEKVVAEWDERNEAAREAHYAKHQAKVREIEDALILGDGDKVVKLLAAIGA